MEKLTEPTNMLDAINEMLHYLALPDAPNDTHRLSNAQTEAIISSHYRGEYLRNKMETLYSISKRSFEYKGASNIKFNDTQFCLEGAAEAQAQALLYTKLLDDCKKMAWSRLRRDSVTAALRVALPSMRGVAFSPDSSNDYVPDYRPCLMIPVSTGQMSDAAFRDSIEQLLYETGVVSENHLSLVSTKLIDFLIESGRLT